jgi:CHAD domain-containing protein
MRERLNRYLDFATMSVDRWALKAIAFDTVADALTATYRKARQLIPEKWQETDAEHLHDLRRRVVEHRHQMDLVEHLWPRLGQVWAEEAQRLRNRLGACQDLAVLMTLTAPHQPLAPWRSRLTLAIETRRAAHLKTAARIASRLFAEKPKAFRRRMAALYSARQARKTKPDGE